MPRLRVGTRASTLALTQTRIFIEQLREVTPQLEVEEVHIQTDGDRSVEPLSTSPTPGLFVSALRDALLAGEVEFIVHSMKDLPAEPFPGITTACVPSREDSRDVLVSKDHRKLHELLPGATVGTSSPRRTAALRHLRPDLNIVDIRGNVDTRISKVRDGDYDATVLAYAGLNRIGRTNEIAQVFDTEFVPAAGQGALSVECLETDTPTRAILALLDDAYVRCTTTAERSVLIGLSAGCATAIGARAKYLHGELSLTAELAVAETGESITFTESRQCELSDLPAAHELGLNVAAQLRAHPLSEKAAWR